MDKQIIASLSTQSGFTPAQRRTFEARVISATRPETAELLYRSIKTVDTHLGVIYEELGVHSLNQAIVLCLQEGWLTFKAVVKSFLLVGFLSGQFGLFDSRDQPMRLPRVGASRVSARSRRYWV